VEPAIRSWSERAGASIGGRARFAIWSGGVPCLVSVAVIAAKLPQLRGKQISPA
jgi:hypothetical protein